MTNIISTCFEELDKYLKDAKNSSLIYICAKPGMGLKTFSKAFTEDIEFSEIKGNYSIFSLYKFSGENKIQKISKISYQLKQMAKELDALVVCTVQMPEYEGKPTLNDLQKIGSIEKDADVIMFLHRDDFTINNRDNSDPDITELIIAKNNYGDTGTVRLKYNSETKQFTEADDL